MTVSLVEIFAAARVHAAPLAAESAGYLLLAVADHVVSAPRVLAAEDVELAGDGTVRLRPRGGASPASDGAEANVRRLLARALALSSSVGPALRRAADRREETGLASLVRELEVALIPVNRSAAKRALSRLHRETERARDAGKLQRLLDDEEPDSVLAAEPVVAVAPPPPQATVAPSPVVPAAEVSLAPPPVVEASSAVRRAPQAPIVELTLTPEPRIAAGEPALTKPEPVMVRARERAGSTPRLGTVVTAQTLPGEEQERTERAPPVEEELEVAVAEEPLEVVLAEELEVVVAEEPLEVVLAEADVSDAALDVVEELALADEETPLLPSKVAAAAEPQALVDPEPSCLPDVLTAMVELHTGLPGDEAPTRLREVVTELREREPEPEPSVELPPLFLADEPELVEDVWLTASSLEAIAVTASPPPLSVSERVAPELHEASTWDPGPVIVTLASPAPPALRMAEPALEPSPYVPAVLPERSSEVRDLVDSFHVSGAAEEQELRSALKEMAGLELTPLSHPLLEKR